MWAFIGTLATLGFLGLGVTGIIKFFRKTGSAGKYFKYAGFSFIIFLFAIAMDPVKPTTTTTANTNNVANTSSTGTSTPANSVTATKTVISPKTNKPKIPPQPAKPTINIQHQNAVKAFEQSIYSLEGSIKPTLEKYQKDMQNLGKTTSIYDAYSSAKNAKDAVSSVRQDFYSLDIPEGLPGEVEDLLKDVRSEMSTAYYCKEEAFDNVLLFLDEQKPSYMENFKEKTSEADQFTLSAVGKLLDAKSKVGIDLADSAK